MSLFRGFMNDFDDDPFFGFPVIINEMSLRKKNSISYTIPAESDDDDDDGDRPALRKTHNQRKKKSEMSSSSHMNPMSHMNSMMNSMLADPFGMFDGFGGMGQHGRGLGGRQLMPFGFPNMNDIFQNFQMNMNDPNCHSFSSSTVMTMSSGPDGRPQVYQASQSTRTAPGGIRETKKSVCDSVTGTKKLAIGHHIGERSHIKEREQNIHSGQVEEREDFINLDEEEADEFNREWETKTRSGINAIGYDQHRVRSRRPREDIPAILDRSNKVKASANSQSESRKGWKPLKRGSRDFSMLSKYRPHSYIPRSRLTSRRHCPAITSSSSSQLTSEKGRKRSQEDKNESSIEENSGKKCFKLSKFSRKKKN